MGCRDAAWVWHFGITLGCCGGAGLELPHHVPLHHINVPAWSCAGLGVNAALCGFAWYTVKHALSVLLSILFFPWVQPSHPAEHGRGRWEYMGAHVLPPSPTPSWLQGPLWTLDQLHQHTWSTGYLVSVVRLGTAGDRMHLPPALGFLRAEPRSPCILP